MTAIFGIALLVLALAIHEAGHAVAMMHRGVRIKEAGIGIPLFKWLRITVRPSWLGFPVVLSPILLGAYVMPTDEGEAELKAMSYKDKAVCYAAGVVTNMSFGGFLLIIALLIRGVQRGDFSLIGLGIGGAMVVVPILLRRLIAMVTPLLGLAALALTVYLIVDSPEDAGGPIEVFKIAGSSQAMLETLVIGAAISLSLAIFNMVPFVPLDGGRVMVALLERFKLVRFAEVYSVVTTIVFVTFFVVLIAKDIMSL